jgi:hypothetical protein
VDVELYVDVPNGVILDYVCDVFSIISYMKKL